MNRSEMEKVKGLVAKPNPLLWCALAVILVLLARPAAAQRQASGASTGGAPSQAALVNQYCVGCHNQKLSTAGVALDGLDLANVGDHASVWERVLRKVR